MSRVAPEENGSVVIEAMVAALIIAAMAAALFEAIHANVAATRAATLRSRALLVAQSQMAAAGAAGPIEPGMREGVDGDLVWRVAARPYAQDADSMAGAVELVSVSVRQEGPARPPLVMLRSLRLGP